MGLYGNFAASSPLSRVCCVILERIYWERSAERALNLGITSALWDTFGSLRSSASCESSIYGLQIFTIAPIVRREIEAIQANVIVPIVRVVSVVSVVFPYDRLDRLVLF